MCRGLLGPPSAGGEVKGLTLPLAQLLAFILALVFVLTWFAAAARFLIYAIAPPVCRSYPSACPCAPPICPLLPSMFRLERALDSACVTFRENVTLMTESFLSHSG